MTTWSLPKGLALRSLMLYAALTILGDEIPRNPLSKFAAWIGTDVLGLGPIAMAMTGSGDRLIDWLSAATCLALAFVGAILWTAIARRKSHPRLLEATRILVRYWLAMILSSTGCSSSCRGSFPHRAARAS